MAESHKVTEKAPKNPYDVASETFTKHKQEIADQLEPIKRHLATVNTALHSFDARAKEQREAHQADIHKRINQLQQTLGQRRTELTGQLDQLTQNKLKTLAAQRDQVELLHTQLTSCLEYVEGSLKTGTQEEILGMKGSLLQQISQITDDFNSGILAPQEEANILLVADSDLHHACKVFADVVDQSEKSVCPEKCYCTGDGTKRAKFGELATFMVHAIDRSDKECQQPVKGLSTELVSCKTNTKVDCQVRRVGESKYEVQYQPVNRGQHQLHIKIYGKSIKGSPYTVVARPSLQSLGKPVRTIGNLQSPWGIAINTKGEIIVAEINGHCLSVFTPEGHKIRSFGSRGSAQGQLSAPGGVAVDRDDNIIVMDSGNHRVQKFTSEGNFLETVGSSRALQFDIPTGVGINNVNEKVYISDGANRIQILNMDLTYFSRFGGSGAGDGQFSDPQGIAFDSINNVYVADTRNCRIQVFTPDGKFLRTFGTSGRNNGQLNYPYSIAIDGNDTIYVADSKNHRISVFTTQGQFLRFIAADEELDYPCGVAIDKNGFILVSDIINNQIQIF